MDTSPIACIQELINNLRNVMEIFSVNLSTDNNNSSSSSMDTVNIGDLEKQMKQFKEELLKNNIKTNEDIGHESCIANISTERKTSYSTSHASTSHAKKCNENENRFLLEERNTLTRENKNLKEEAVRLRNENSVIKKKLEEEALSRQRIQRELSEFTNILEANRMACKSGLSETQNNNKSELPETQNKTKLSESQNNYKIEVYEKQSNTCLSETQNNTIQRFFYEKVNTCTPHADDGLKEREKLRFQNIELERQLNKAKKTVRSHEKRLLVYSQLLNNPTSINFTHNLKPQSYPKASSAPTSPSDIETNTIQQSLFRKYYDTNINELHMNVKYGQRKFRSCDSISTDCSNYTVSTNCTSQGFDWRYTEMDVLARKGRSCSDTPKYPDDYKSS